jgi:hypothetical protein
MLAVESPCSLRKSGLPQSSHQRRVDHDHKGMDTSLLVCNLLCQPVAPIYQPSQCHLLGGRQANLVDPFGIYLR